MFSTGCFFSPPDLEDCRTAKVYVLARRRHTAVSAEHSEYPRENRARRSNGKHGKPLAISANDANTERHKLLSVVNAVPVGPRRSHGKLISRKPLAGVRQVCYRGTFSTQRVTLLNTNTTRTRRPCITQGIPRLSVLFFIFYLIFF